MLARYRHMISRGAMATLAAAVFVAVTAFTASAQTIYYDINSAPPSMDVGNTCTTTNYVDSDGNISSYVSCAPSYTIYYTPGYNYFFVSP
jgi:spore coat protein U-like protein